MPDRPLFEHILLPIASTQDAITTCDVVLPYAAARSGRVTAISVVEVSSGWPGLTPKDELQKHSQEMLDVVIEHGAQHSVRIDTQVVFAQDVTDAIIDAAEEIAASAIVFTPRSTRWWRSLVPGEIASKLVRESHFPVVVLPPKRRQPSES